ncbi:Hypothetical predicted protein [Marmota monax]|uniref:Uncharacterized protein n=1 Tax=Marmota monax TaxID=9995 RepID=A0A5E4DD71_MARMO|nr:hypothetical protein GHT09_017446 [Marmota monax]VTJ92083.1 Hypothetical predicted protein [Marmota monax]
MAEVEAAQLKEEGNRHFQSQDYKAATKSYSQALKLTKDKSLLATLYRNRAACGLKMESYVQAASDASRAADWTKHPERPTLALKPCLSPDSLWHNPLSSGAAFGF